MKFLAFLFLTFLTTATFAQRVAVLQLVTHPALNAVNQGVQSELIKNKVAKESILYNNPQGDFGTMNLMAKKMLESKPDVFIAIATPSAQAALNAMKAKPVPLVFSTVTDPIGAKLVANLEKPGGNVTGVRNFSPMVRQLQAIREIMPSVKRIGIILNYAESNSVHSLEFFQAAAKEYGIEVAAVGSSNSSEVKAATLSLIPKVDGFFLIQDNTVASALPTLLKTTKSFKKPVFASYVEAVEQGALFGLAFDEFEIGRQTAKIALRILKGETPGSIAVEEPDVLLRALNRKTAQDLGLKLSEEVIKSMDKVYPQPK